MLSILPKLEAKMATRLLGADRARRARVASFNFHLAHRYKCTPRTYIFVSYCRPRYYIEYITSAATFLPRRNARIFVFSTTLITKLC